MPKTIATIEACQGFRASHSPPFYHPSDLDIKSISDDPVKVFMRLLRLYPLMVFVQHGGYRSTLPQTILFSPLTRARGLY
jgi:hypothetical protein